MTPGPATNAVTGSFVGASYTTGPAANSVTGSFVQPAGDRFAYPDADISTGAWSPSTGADLYAMLDEETPSDTDYIYATGPSACTVSLSPVIDPGTSDGQDVHYRVRSDHGGTLIVRLKQGTTTIATRTHTNVPASWIGYTMTLTPAECDAITDYSALRIELEAV